MRPVMAGEPRPPPRRDTVKGVGRGRAESGAAVRDARRGRGRPGARRSRAREGDGVGDGPGLLDMRVYRRSGLIARYRAGRPALASRGPTLTICPYVSQK